MFVLQKPQKQSEIFLFVYHFAMFCILQVSTRAEPKFLLMLNILCTFCLQNVHKMYTKCSTKCSTKCTQNLQQNARQLLRVAKIHFCIKYIFALEDREVENALATPSWKQKENEKRAQFFLV